MEFGKCLSVGAPGHINTLIPNTSINRLKIFTGNIGGVAILVSLCSMENRISQYRLDVAQGVPSLQVTKTPFDHFQQLIPLEKRIVITAAAKSIKRVSLSAFRSGEPRNNEANLS